MCLFVCCSGKQKMVKVKFQQKQQSNWAGRCGFNNRVLPQISDGRPATQHNKAHNYCQQTPQNRRQYQYLYDSLHRAAASSGFGWLSPLYKCQEIWTYFVQIFPRHGGGKHRNTMIIVYYFECSRPVSIHQDLILSRKLIYSDICSAHQCCFSKYDPDFVIVAWVNLQN